MATKWLAKAVELADQNPDILGTRVEGAGEAEHLLYGHHVDVLGVHGGQIIEPVYEGNDLVEGQVLGMALEAAVQVTDVGNDVDHLLAFRQHLQAQHAVGAGVLGAHVEHELALRQRPPGKEAGLSRVES